ncbi:MAG: hypothetical protein KAJ52_06345 [Sedimentisphaerales bacterium]|nr:hypothetical protein [Sedimentisphaerales bacterium]
MRTGVYRITATGIIIKDWHQRRYQPYAARNAGRGKAAMPLAPPRCSGRSPALSIPRDGRSIIPYLPEAIKR